MLKTIWIRCWVGPGWADSPGGGGWRAAPCGRWSSTWSSSCWILCSTGRTSRGRWTFEQLECQHYQHLNIKTNPLEMSSKSERLENVIGICLTDLQLNTSTNGSKRVYTSPQEISLTSYFGENVHLTIIQNFYKKTFCHKQTQCFKIAFYCQIALKQKSSIYQYIIS